MREPFHKQHLLLKKHSHENIVTNLAWHAKPMSCVLLPFGALHFQRKAEITKRYWPQRCQSTKSYYTIIIQKQGFFLVVSGKENIWSLKCLPHSNSLSFFSKYNPLYYIFFFPFSLLSSLLIFLSKQKEILLPWLGGLFGWSIMPCTKRLRVPSPQGTYLGCGFNPWSGHI